MHLPEFLEFQISDLPVLGRNLQKPNDALADIQTTYAAVGNKTPEKYQRDKFSALLLESPTPPKSPLSFINSLRKHILRSSSSSHPIRTVGRPDIDDSKNDFKDGNLKDVAVDNKSSSPEKYQRDKFSALLLGSPTPPKSPLSFINSLRKHMLLSSSSSHPIRTVGRPDIDDSMNDFKADSIVQLIEQSEVGEVTPHNHENAAGGLLEEVSRTARSGSMTGEFNVENLNSSGPILVDDREPEPQFIDPEPQLSLSSGQKLNEKTKANAPQCRRKAPRGRQSLAGAGTSWKFGVRRSMRIRSRPLKFWKGERFLYGRVHSSTTVIGLKYASLPPKGKGEATMKVKSYVSDEYKELVEVAALH